MVSSPVTLGAPSRPRNTEPAAVVALIRPPVLTLEGSLATHGPTPPIGVAYLAAALRQGGHEVHVIDAPGLGIDQVSTVPSPVGSLRRWGLTDDEIVERIPHDAQLVGLSLMFIHEWPTARALVRSIRSHRPDAAIVIGGETATAAWRTLTTECPEIDYVVLGEGETTLLALADALADGRRPVASAAGLVVVAEPDAEALAELPTRQRDLGTIPRPAWDLIPVDRYLDHPYFGVHRGRSMPVLATRGCPYRCSFCSSPQMWTTRYVTRDPDDVADEIAELVARHQLDNVNFADLTAITKRRWTLEFCDALEARNLRITWQLPVGTRAEALDAEVLQRLHDTGCRNITYAPESGSARMLEVYDKRVDLDHIVTSLRAARRVGMRTHVNIIVGHPAERWRDVAASVRFLLRAAIAGCDDCAPILFCPYPGSADHAALAAAGDLPTGDEACYLGLARSSSRARSFNPQLGATVQRTLQLAMLALFYAVAMVRRPSRAVQFVHAQVTGDERTYLDQMVRTLRRSALAPAAAPAPPTVSAPS